MMRMTGRETPHREVSVRIEVPAAIETRAKRSPRDRRSFQIGARRGNSSPSICGFTPRKIYLHERATASLSAAAQPSSRASASAFAAVRLERSTLSGGHLQHTARARAPPIFPTPMNPNVYMTCSFFRAFEKRNRMDFKINFLQKSPERANAAARSARERQSIFRNLRRHSSPKTPRVSRSQRRI